MTKKKKIDFSEPAPPTLEGCPFYGYILDEEQQAFSNAIYSKDIDIVLCNAPAGTGKNLVAVGTANIMVQYGLFDEIIYIVSPYGEKKQGFLPGDYYSKSAVYYDPLYQALVSCGINPNTAVNTDGLTGQKAGGYITCITDTFLRGVTFSRSIIIIDESQNMTIPQLKKTLTRVNDTTKVIVMGHDKQCDLEDSRTSGFVRYIRHFEGKERAAICTLSTNHRGWVSQWADELLE